MVIAIDNSHKHKGRSQGSNLGHDVQSNNFVILPVGLRVYLYLCHLFMHQLVNKKKEYAS